MVGRTFGHYEVTAHSIVPPAGSDYLNPSLSPDGTRLAVNNMDPDSGNWDIWVIDLESRIPTHVTSDPAQDSDAIWSPDSNEIVFVSNRGGTFGLYRKQLRGAGAEELLLKTAVDPRPTDWTRDGRFLVYEVNKDVYALPLTGADHTTGADCGEPVCRVRRQHVCGWAMDRLFLERIGRLPGLHSTVPRARRKKRVSTVFGIHPRWRRDVRELVYWQPPAALMSVEPRYDSAGVHSSTPVSTLPPHIGILTVVDNRHHHAMSADGQRWLLREPAGPPGPPIHVVVNWTDALRR
jgi:hypothetical protein